MADHRIDPTTGDDAPPGPPLFWLGLGIFTGIAAFFLGWLIAPLAGLVFTAGALLCVALTLYTPVPALAWTHTRRGALALARRDTLVSRHLGLLALILLVLSAYHYNVGMQRWLFKAGWLLTGGGLLVGAALFAGWRHHLNGPDTPYASGMVGRRIVTRTRWLPFAAGLILMALTAEINGDIIDPAFIKHISYHAQFVILCLGIILLAWGAAGKRVYLDDDAPRSRIYWLLRIDRAEVLAVTAIVLLALVVRFYQLGSAVHLFVDEIHFSNPVMHFYQATDIELLLPFSSVAAFPYLYPYMQWHAVQVLGRNLEGLRMVSVLFGTVNVLALYLLARELFDRRVALLAAVILAVFPPHIQFSRLGLNNVADPVFGTFALYFIARGLRHPPVMRAHFAAAGAMLGLTQYFYEGGRLLYPVLALVWLGMIGLAVYGGITLRYVTAWLRRDRRELSHLARQTVDFDYRHLFRSAAVMLVVAVLIGAPIYYTLVGQGRDVAIRLQTAGLRENTTSTMTDPQGFVRHFVNRVQESFLIHVSIPEAQLYYGGSTSLLLVFAIPFFFIGMFYALWRIDRPGALLLLLWIGMTWMGNALMQESRISARYVVAFPALALIVGLGVVQTLDLLWPRSPQIRNRLLAALASIAIVLHIAYYFGPHLTTFNRQFRGDINRNLDSHDVLFRAAAFPPDTHIHVIGDPVMPERDASNLLHYLADHLWIRTMHPDYITPEYLRALVVNRDHAFFVHPDDTTTIARIREFFPNVQGPIFSPYDLPRGKQFALYYSERLSFAPGRPPASASPTGQNPPAESSGDGP